MRHTPSFTKFLKNAVNLPQGRIDQLDTNVDAVFEALQTAEILGPYVLDKLPQGSWPHRTIIRPVDDLEFDADFLLHLSIHTEWIKNPSKYLDHLETALRAHGVYSSMVDDKIKSRCVRVNYADEHHVDIVPYVILADGRKVVINRDTNDWEDTDPQGFTNWMQTSDESANGNMRKTIRLIKYLRDIHGAFPDVPSIIITALVGKTITDTNRIEGKYSDVPTALRQIISDLNSYLTHETQKPSISDPSGASHPNGRPVTFDHRWTEATYQSFRTNIATYNAAIDSAYLEMDEVESVKKWRQVFGENFTAPPPKVKPRNRLGPGVVPPASTVSSRGG